MALHERLIFWHKRQEPLAWLWQEMRQVGPTKGFEPTAWGRGFEDALVEFSRLVQERKVRITRIS